MGKKIFYRQCRYEQLVPNESGGKKWDVAWLPESVARLGGHIYFGEKRSANEDEMWIITLVGDTRRSAEWLHEKQNADRKQRKASDV